MNRVVLLIMTVCLVISSVPQRISAASFSAEDAQDILECINEPEPIAEILTDQGRAQFSYDEKRNRISKVWLDNMTTYHYQENKLDHESSNGVELSYFYEYTEDGEERYSGFTYENETYYYGYSDDGRIDFLLDMAHNYVCKYEYDSFMKPISYRYVDGEFMVVTDKNFVGNINPICYYGWYYDKEIEYYYVGDGIYYNPFEQIYVNNAYSVDEEKLSNFIMQKRRSAEPDEIRIITDYYTYIMSVSSFGAKAYDNVTRAEWNSGRRWYDGIDRTELVARCIYAENTGENLKEERVAIAVAIANRVLYKSQDQDAYGAVTRISQFASINPGSYDAVSRDTANARKIMNKSAKPYQEAILLAVTICHTTDKDVINSIYKIPDYIDKQTEFLRLNTVYEGNWFGISGGQWYYYANWGTEKIKNVAIAGKDIFRKPVGTMKDILNPYYQKGHNIFFEYGVEDESN